MHATGDTVVHPRHGVAKVLGVVTRGEGADRRSYLELVVLATSLKIMVPMDAVDDVGIRQLPTRREAEAILSVLAQPSDVSPTWSERAAATAERVRSTELTQASMVVRDLTRHAQRSGKPLSTSESSILRSCLQSVSSELSLVLEISEDDARDLILDAAEQGGASDAAAPPAAGVPETGLGERRGVR